jgi:hypothetical protein
MWALLLLLFSGCSYIYQGEWLAFPDPESFTGRISLEAGRGFDDVDMTLIRLGDEEEDQETYPISLSQRGEFREEDLEPGEYAVIVAKPRYDPYRYEFSLEVDEKIYLEIELKRYSIPDRIWSVRVVADFLDWDAAKALPMADDDGDGVWQMSTPLPSGRFSYKYIINDLPEWFIDIDSRIWEPDGQGYYRSVVELKEVGLVDFHLDTNDPWFRRLPFVEPAPQGGVGWAIWEPEEPRRGQEIAILYDARGGPLEDAQQMLLHWGVNDWAVPPEIPRGSSLYEDGRAVQTPMQPLSQGTWWAVVPTDENVSTVDFIFADGIDWDDNLSQGWHISLR